MIWNQFPGLGNFVQALSHVEMLPASARRGLKNHFAESAIGVRVIGNWLARLYTVPLFAAALNCMLIPGAFKYVATHTPAAAWLTSGKQAEDCTRPFFSRPNKTGLIAPAQ